MGAIKPDVESHVKLIEEVKEFLEGKSKTMPNLGSGRFDRQAYKYALVVDTLMEKVDSLIDELKKKGEEKGAPVTCSAGCSECCSQPVGINIPEMFYIAEYLNQNPAVKERFLAKYPAWRKNINPAVYDRILQSMMTSGPNELGIDLAVSSFYKGIAVPCPFLEKDLCDIYPVRPLVCRHQMSVSDPQKCRDNVEVQMPVYYNLELFVAEKFSQLMVHILKNIGLHNTNAMANFPMTVREFVMNGQKYVEFYVKNASRMI